MATDYEREQLGVENADERYERLKVTGEHVGDWSRWCSVPDYCTRPCTDCGREARRASEVVLKL